MKSRLYLLMTLLFITIMLVSGCSFDDQQSLKEKTEISKKEEINEEKSEKDLEKEIEDIEKEYEAESPARDSYEDDYETVSPFTGLGLDSTYYKRAVSVSIENSPGARPQSGLDQAEIVYEFMLEGGITRFLAIFWPEVPVKIGPIRSARPALIESSEFYDALFLHAGASPRGFALLEVNDVLHLDQIYKSQYFWRSSKKAAPHNLYSGSKALKKYLKNLSEKEYQEQFNFLTASIVSDFEKAENIKIDYWGPYAVFYQYDSLNNNYLRFLNDKSNPHLVEGGKQLKAKNIIVQHVKTSTIDSADRQDIDLDSGGKMQLFRDGIVIKGDWKKRNGKIVYLNSEAEEIEINPGQSWIQVVPNGTDIIY